MTIKFHRWADTYRSPTIEEDKQCCLCDETAECFTFQDNEAYGLECLCKECLAEAMRLLEEGTDG